MELKISHEEFCRKLKNNEIVWGINNFWFSIFDIFKFRAVFIYFLFFLLFVFSILPIVYFAYSESFWFLILVIPVFSACLSGSAGLSMPDLAFWFSFFLISAACSIIFGYDFYRVGILPFFCFFISSAIKGMIIQDVENKLVNSSEIYQVLNDKQYLICYANHQISKNL
jgi:hypothetical protein